MNRLALLPIPGGIACLRPVQTYASSPTVASQKVDLVRTPASKRLPASDDDRRDLRRPRIQLGDCLSDGAERREILCDRTELQRSYRIHVAGVGRQTVLLDLAIGQRKGAHLDGRCELFQFS